MGYTLATGFLWTQTEAHDFFASLREASVEIMNLFGLPTSQGGKCYSSWQEGQPVGCTEHYTAGIGWKGSISWLNDGPNKNQVSCQFLILDRMIPEAQAVYNKYPALRCLKVTVFMLSDGLIPCWHAGWVNRLTFGIENRNAGLLTGSEGNWRWWAGKFPHKALGKTPVTIDGLWWEPYTRGQIEANVIVGQMAHCLYQNSGGLKPGWFLPHSATTGGKWDTGRLYPLNDVRDAVFYQTAVENLHWLSSFEADPLYMDHYDEDEDTEYFEKMAAAQYDRSGGEDWGFGIDEVSVVPSADLQALVQDGDWKAELPAIRRALNLLSYYIDPLNTVPLELDADTALAVFQFQKSMDLKADKIPGDSETQPALMRRLQDFRLVR